jgi:hypothetical protein
MYLPTVAWETSIPTLSNSPWIRGAPRERIGHAHFLDQLPHLLINRRAAGLAPLDSSIASKDESLGDASQSPFLA